MINVDQAVQRFQQREGLYQQACKATVSLLERLLDGSGIRLHSINPRVKSASSLREKLGRQGKSYSALSDVKDLVGIRIITYFEDDLVDLGRILSAEFTIDADHSYDRKSKLESDRFGYRSIHYVCRYSADRLRLAEYKAFEGVDLEIQTRSILQHAWAEIEHEYYKSKGQKPPEIQRRNSILAGLLELADAEFIAIRKAMEVYRSNVELQIEVEDTLENVGIDAISLESFVMQDAMLAALDRNLSLLEEVEVRHEPDHNSISTTLRLLKVLEVRTLEDLRSLLTATASDLPEFMRRFREWNRAQAGGVSESYPRGISIYHAGLCASAKRDKSFLQELFRAVYQDKVAPSILGATIDALPTLLR